MSLLLNKVITDIWTKSTWQEYIEAIADPNFIKANPKAKCYYFHAQMRIENIPVGSAHARAHTLFIAMINLFAALKGIDLNGFDNCTFRKIGTTECQPDIAYYLEDSAQAVPVDAGIINLELYPVPDLVIEIASSSISDDKGEKRLLYESLGVGEYWIVDVQNLQITALAIADGGSRQIRISQILKGLEISLLEETLQSGQNQSQAIAILISQWQN